MANLSKLTKAELIAQGKSIGLTLSTSMLKADIITAIEKNSPQANVAKEGIKGEY